MQAQYLQNLRYKLQRRIRRLTAASESQTLYFRLKEFWAFFDSQPVLAALAAELVAKRPYCSASVDRIFARELLFGETELESAAIGYGVLRRYVTAPNPNTYLSLIDPNSGKFAEALEQFRTLYLEPFYEYVDEHLDDRSFVLQNLLRYKHACEWFRRDRLHRIWRENTQRGEHLLAFDLYEYLHEREIDFHIEPWSASGEADMVSLQQSNDPLIADAKIFNPEAGKPKSYILRGFHQLYQYTCDYNQPIGYLVVFNVSQTPLRFAFESGAESVPRVTLNYKTIFAIDIDLFPHAEPASRRKLGEVVIITQADLESAVATAKTP